MDKRSASTNSCRGGGCGEKTALSTLAFCCLEPASAPWFVYLVRCRDGTLYTGITTDLARRLKEHNCGPRGARYTRSRRPVTLVYSEAASSRSQAAQREWQIKRLTVVQKWALVGGG